MKSYVIVSAIITTVLVGLLLMGVDWSGENVLPNATLVEEKHELIASATTTYDSPKSRQKNIELAATAVNGIVMKPLEIFSYNQILGERTEEKGYMKAASFLKKNGKVQTIETLGGGICQVSSTLYMAIKECNLEVLERHPHSKRVSYCKKEDEAMVSYGTSDFVFKNNFNFKIKLECVITEVEDSNEKILTCNIYKIL